METNTLTLYQVDAFTSKVFSGNPAAVCFLDSWLPDELMQSIAAENNLAETAFLVAASADNATFSIRWFTPTVEIPLCGHATLAAAHVLFEHLACTADRLSFHSKGGELSVVRHAKGYALNLPAFAAESLPISPELEAAIGRKIVGQYQGNYLMAVLEDSAAVASAQPDLQQLATLAPNGCLVITAAGEKVDFVSRFFAPGVGIDEDPVTGSAHCLLTPFWASELGKPVLTARQLSQRGGDLECSLDGDEVTLVGQCATYLLGSLYLD